MITRRGFLAGSAVGLMAPLSTCELVRDRPVLTHGVAAGDVRVDGALIWARADRPARLIVETASSESFLDVRRLRGDWLTPETDGTGRLRITGLPAGQRVYYRVSLEDERGVQSDTTVGSFWTAPITRSDVRLQWSGDLAGQGFGRNPDIGGYRIFDAMLARDPQLFLHSGDTIYADGPLTETSTLPDGRVWRNVVSDAKSAVAQSLDEYRGQFAYNLEDEKYRRFNSRVAQIVQWDDHEVVNNWYPGEVLDRPEYAEKNVDVLARRAYQAFHEWQPLESGRIYRKIPYGPLLDILVLDMRSYRDANSANMGDAGYILGDEQTQWFIDALSASTATWKIIMADLPLGLVVPDGPNAFEAVANGDPEAPRGREVELARILSAIKSRGITNVVWLTADVHYTAAHHYSPERATFTDFDPFWEFVSGPMNAGGGDRKPLDPTFGGEAVFVHGAAGSSPLDDYQHFGCVSIDGASGELTVELCDTAGRVLFAKSLVAH